MQALLSCLAFISRLDCLTHLTNLIHIKAKEGTVAGASDIDTIVQRIGRASTTLQYLCFYNPAFYMVSSTWVTIERDEEGMYTGWHYMTDLQGIHPNDWGSFFQGAGMRHYMGPLA